MVNSHKTVMQVSEFKAIIVENYEGTKMIVEAAIVGGIGGLGVAGWKIAKAVLRHNDNKFWKMGSASHLEQPHLGPVSHLHGKGKPQSAKSFFGLFG